MDLALKVSEVDGMAACWVFCDVDLTLLVARQLHGNFNQSYQLILLCDVVHVGRDAVVHVLEVVELWLHVRQLHHAMEQHLGLVLGLEVQIARVMVVLLPSKWMLLWTIFVSVIW